MEPKDLKIGCLYQYQHINPKFGNVVLVYFGYRDDQGYVFLNLKTLEQRLWYPQVLDEF